MKHNELKISFTGDSFVDETVINLYKNNKYDFDECYKKIKKTFSSCDYVVCNLETPISDDDNELSTGNYKFCSPLTYLKSLNECGIDCFTIANNHCLDNGIEGLNKTIRLLNKLGIDNTGAKSKYIVKELCGVKIGIYSCTYGTNAFNNNIYLSKNNFEDVNLIQNQELSNSFIRLLYNSNSFVIKLVRIIFRKFHLFQMNKYPYERISSSHKRKKIIKRDITELKKKCDIVFVCLHDGLQNNENPSINIEKNISFFSKLKVDMIICNHEHLIQKVGKINNVPVCYCLGNFSSPTGSISSPLEERFLYSILINVYVDLDTKKITKKSFNILKQNLEIKNGKKFICVQELDSIIDECKNISDEKKLKKKRDEIITLISDKIKKSENEYFYE